jgi:hypothetical protein
LGIFLGRTTEIQLPPVAQFIHIDAALYCEIFRFYIDDVGTIKRYRPKFRWYSTRFSQGTEW